tara:strand:+ start:203 stop:1219 length:1017 start_codon:yes stop_codon:yes gene_type:complete
MNREICFFCVGTGGHVLPVKNLILELNNLGIDTTNIFVVCDERAKKYLEDLDVNIFTTQIYFSKNGIKGYVFNFIKILSSTKKIYNFLKKLNISVVLTTGAYIAPVAALMSLLLRAKFYIQEQNVYAGLGNKVSAFFAESVFISFENTRNIKKNKIKYTGPIVNTTLLRKDEASLSTQTIGFVGGSQGSEEINNFVEQFLNSEIQSKFNIVHITGKNKNTFKVKKTNYKSIEFVKNMDDFYKEVDILVGRAGGGSLEAAYLGIPQILIPYKYGTTSSHQKLNAKYLEENKFGHIVYTFDDLLDKVEDISIKLKSNKLQLKRISIGNKKIAQELYEQIN